MAPDLISSWKICFKKRAKTGKGNDARLYADESLNVYLYSNRGMNQTGWCDESLPIKPDMVKFEIM